MNINTFNSYYFIGIGGIGMSALARYFHALGKHTAGYDRTPKPLTRSLEAVGIDIHYQDNPERIAPVFQNPERTLVVYTPAVPDEHQELQYFRRNNFRVMKRAAVLGLITQSNRSIAVAGTHGKTTISSMIAHVLHQGNIPANAFLGGLPNNYRTNLLLSGNAEKGLQQETDFAVVEADEYDRSFLHLSPEIAVISAIDPDHLDIYGTYNQLLEAFGKFTENLRDGGTLIVNHAIKDRLEYSGRYKVYTYSMHDEEAAIHAANMQRRGLGYQYDIVLPGGDRVEGVKPEWPARINIENAVAAAGAAWLAGANPQQIKTALSNFSGIWRRFDMHIHKADLVYIDDYAHHPKEIEQTLDAARDLFPGKKLTGIFQPHLYSRTRDFAEGFADALSALDELLLLPVYPAREQPIPGVTSSLVYQKVQMQNKYLVNPEELIQELKKRPHEVVLTMGAGDIDQLVESVKTCLLDCYKDI